jgi:tetratricopeptide (TPR) repeat protein
MWRGLLGVAFMAFALTPCPAFADPAPSCWERALDEHARSDAQLHRDVSVQLERAARARGPRADEVARTRAEAELKRTQTRLEARLDGSTTSSMLAFDLAAVYHELREHVQCASLLERELAKQPDAAWSERGWYMLSLSYAMQNLSGAERRTHARAMSHIVDAQTRQSMLSNWAEAELRDGDLVDAIARFRAAIDIAQRLQPGGASAVLARYGLAVALDRSGDESGALREATLAVAADTDLATLLNDPSVFFVPEYERFWYLSIALQAKARVSGAADDRTMFLRNAISALNRWVDDAGAAHPSYPLAQARLRRLQTATSFRATTITR